MKEPEIVIVIEGGVVIAVGTTKDSLEYRVIDLDARKVGEHGIEDMEADATGIDVEEYTKEMSKETGHQKDCGCGECSGENRALEIMEKGICQAEKSYTE